MLLGSHSVLHNVWLEVEIDVSAIGDNPHDTAHNDADEYCTVLTKIEVVDVDIHEWKSFEKGIIYPYARQCRASYT